jgi:hypothetical protein
MRPNKLIDTDVLSAGFAGLLSAGHRRRYAAAARIALSSSAIRVGRGSVSFPQALGRSEVYAACMGWQRTAAGFGRSVSSRAVAHAVPRSCKNAAGVSAASLVPPQALCAGSGSQVEGCRSAQSVSAAPEAGICGVHNRLVETDTQVRPCAARTRLLCAAHLQR